ncbi:phosphatase PAP2 family protein [Halomonas sp. SL1]|uniref:phosphatase PAP2 family protein n=1 Tax=Halomonas sp. SL1 TaxID=2137478 RepID=UPI000D1611AF|nr:phosphatase PAP2 family protein [Halomonas sp. SL1]RAH37856.1 phosphatase PAP2 family protein [Halomonas sp. SL1]
MQLRRILFYNLLGFALIASWWLPTALAWTRLDDDVFYFFNQFIGPAYPYWTEFLAALNTRTFDLAMFAVLMVMMFFAMHRDPRGSWQKWLAIGLVMSAVAALLGELLHQNLLAARPSPTLWHQDVNFLSEHTALAAKDEASNSFPSDHGLMAMVFASFMLRFADRLIASLAVALSVLVTLPRIMGGAHWVSDVYLGSLAIALVVLPWVLCNASISTLIRRLATFFDGACRRLGPVRSWPRRLYDQRGMLKRISAYNLAGVLLLLSWAVPHGILWTDLDDHLFWLFNAWISPENPHWADLLAVLNSRAFDAISFGILGLLFTLAMRRDTREDRVRHWTAIGVTMLITAGIVALITNEAISYGHPSPTRFFEHAARLTDIVSIPTKDSDANSFPGDHGLMLMVFAGFMLRFADRCIAGWSLAFVVLLSAPRILVGAHWFSDVYIGALSIALLLLPWVLCTPMAEGLTRAIRQALPRLPLRH